MKLYNKTRIPDAVIEPLLVEAGRVAHARTTGVIVIVNPNRSRYTGCKGLAHRAFRVYQWVLSSRQRNKDGNYKERLVSTDGGYFSITLPIKWDDSLAAAQEFFRVAVHEWTHIKQYQTGYRFDRTERKKRHDNRPWEKEANKAMNSSTDRLHIRRQDAILNLALEIEKRKAL